MLVKYFFWVLRHILIFCLGSVIYMLSFHVPILDVTEIFFYDGIFRLVIILTIVIIIENILKKYIRFDYKDIWLSICLLFFVNMLFLSVCLVSLDRSLSVYLLCYLDAYSTPVSYGKLEGVFQEDFIEKHRMLERRFTEQEKSGNIVFSDDGYILTSRGKLMVTIFKEVGKIYKINPQFINP